MATTPRERASALMIHLVREMEKQMFAPEHLDQPDWTSSHKSFPSLREDLTRNENKLLLAVAHQDVEEAWRRAANIANFAGMIAARLEQEVALARPNDSTRA